MQNLRPPSPKLWRLHHPLFTGRLSRKKKETHFIPVDRSTSTSSLSKKKSSNHHHNGGAGKSKSKSSSHKSPPSTSAPAPPEDDNAGGSAAAAVYNVLNFDGNKGRTDTHTIWWVFIVKELGDKEKSERN